MRTFSLLEKAIPSISNSFRFISTPPWNPPSSPFDFIALCHGMIIGNGLFARAFPTALAPLGIPISLAIRL